MNTLETHGNTHETEVVNNPIAVNVSETISKNRNDARMKLKQIVYSNTLPEIQAAIETAKAMPTRTNDVFLHFRLIQQIIDKIDSGEKKLSLEEFNAMYVYIEHVIDKVQIALQKKEDSLKRIDNSTIRSWKSVFPFNKWADVRISLNGDIRNLKRYILDFENMKYSLEDAYKNQGKTHFKGKKRSTKSDFSSGFNGAISGAAAASVLDPDNLVSWGLAGMAIGDILGDEEEEDNE